MGKYKDLTGQRFGKLVAVSRAKNYVGKGIRWECKCDCGNTTTVAAYHLKDGSTQSCGCIRHPNLTGLRFGRLTVIKKSHQNEANNWIWECICDCGKKHFAKTSMLLNGNVRSCGCLQKDIVTQLMTGNRFKNIIEDVGEYLIVYDNKKRFFYIDKCDVKTIEGSYWIVDNGGYVKNSISGELLHRVLTNCPERMTVDHINHVKIDNRRKNLRVCTMAQNSWNKKLPVGSSGITGVFKTKSGKYRASIKANGTEYNKIFDCIDDAEKQRKEWVEKLHGEYAYEASISRSAL